MEHIPGYDEWKTTPPEPNPVLKCDFCGRELFEGDFVYTICGENFCEDCVNNNFRRTIECL